MMISVFPKWLSSLLGLILLMTAASVYAESQQNAVYFKAEDWGQEQLSILSQGPHILPRDLPITISEPPASNSSETMAELQYLHGLVSQRTPEMVKLITDQNTINPAILFLQAAMIDSQTKPQTIQFITGLVVLEGGFFIMREKWRFQRARSYAIDPTLTILIPPPPHASYPSGHAGQGRMIALVLGKLDPAHREIYESYAVGYGKNREYAGVHFPSDTNAGVSVADQVMSALFNNQQFMDQLEKIRNSEWK